MSAPSAQLKHEDNADGDAPSAQLKHEYSNHAEPAKTLSAEDLSEGGAGQGRAVPGQALSAGKLPAPLAEDVLSARWVAVPRPAAARGNVPRGRSQRALLQDDGGDGASSGNSTGAPSSLAALLLIGLDAAVPADSNRSPARSF